MTAKQTTLWSWLTKNEAKTEIYCPPGLRVTTQQFAEELASQVKANDLPAEVELYEVNWDDTDTRQTRVIVRHTGSAEELDIVQFIVGIDQMGNFAYVEEKVNIRPPKFPKIPREPKSQESRPSQGLFSATLIGGAVLILAGYVIASNEQLFGGLVIGIIGGLIFLQGWREDAEIRKEQKEKLQAWEEKLQAREEWNRLAEQEQKAWDEAIETWYKQVLEAPYLSSTDDVYGRFILAVSSTVKQVVKRLFEDRQAELRQRIEQEKTQKEIEQELEKRKQEGFK